MEQPGGSALIPALLALIAAGLLTSGLGEEIVDLGSGEIDNLDSVADGADAVLSGSPGSGEENVQDVVDKFLSIVEQYERNKDNCTPGVNYNLGKGVVDQYGVKRFKAQAMVAVHRAELLTRIWKGAPRELLDSEFFFYSLVRSMVESDPNLFAAGNCYDFRQFKNYTLFCPYAYRMPNDSQGIMVKDLSVEYKYLGNDSEFFFQPREKARRKLAEEEEAITYSLGKYRLHSVHWRGVVVPSSTIVSVVQASTPLVYAVYPG